MSLADDTSSLAHLKILYPLIDSGHTYGLSPANVFVKCYMLQVTLQKLSVTGNVQDCGKFKKKILHAPGLIQTSSDHESCALSLV